MNAQEIFENHGLNFTDSEQVAAELEDMDVEDLWNITDDFLVDSLEVNGDEDTQAAGLRAALVHAFENNLEAITQQDFDLACEQALQIGDATEDGEPEQEQSADSVDPDEDEQSDADADDDPEQSADSAETNEDKPEQKQAKGERRNRRSKNKAVVRRLVEEDPAAEVQTIVERAQQELDLAETTLCTYYYDVRRTLGLAGTGRRGRRPNDTAQQVRQYILDNWDCEADEIINGIFENFDLAETTAKGYYYRELRVIENS